ncbi:MAG: putative toxin-antitoxin system toxin component, PIN family [Sphingomonadaceae bacterium]|jgi:putative PIN family toxin of toxin-antitoxin system
MTLRLVLDTNVWLDWLVFRDACVAPLRAAVESGRAEVCIDAACEEELARVLAYPLGRTVLDPAAQAVALAECRRVARAAAGAPLACHLPPCSDPEDQKFLELARDCRADLLVTKDRALLVLARHAPFRIVTPSQAGEALG